MTDLPSSVSDKNRVEPSVQHDDAARKLAESFTQNTGDTLSALRTLNAPPTLKPADNALLDEIEHAHFNYFVDQSDKTTGLTKDRSTPDSAASIAAVGFSLTAHAIGVERGWTSREEATDYTLKVLKTLWNAPQGDAATGNGGNHGFFYHFLDPKNGTRMWNSELSTIDTALLMSGVLFAKDYFNGDNKNEAEVRDLADKLYKRVDWPWALNSEKRVSMGWSPEGGFIQSDWQGYNEAMILHLLGIGSPTHPLPPETWKNYHDTDTTKTYGGQTYIDFPPLFGHQYSQAWVDFRGIMDDKNKSLGFDYFENSRRATLAQNYYGETNPPNFRGYSKLDWGWTASDGPGADARPNGELSASGFASRFAASKPSAYDLRSGRHLDEASNKMLPERSLVLGPSAAAAAPGAAAAASSSDDGGGLFRPAARNADFTKPTKFLSYSARGAPDYIDDGTIAPTAAASAIAFAPELVLPTLAHWRQTRPEIWSNDGFKDAFNPAANPSKPSGWVDTDTLGIDQGPIVLMTENYRSGLVWNTMKRDPYITEGLKKAGFTGAYLDAKPKQ